MFSRCGAAGRNIGAQAVDIAPHLPGGKHSRGKVAIGAFGAAKRDRDVKAEGQRLWKGSTLIIDKTFAPRSHGVTEKNIKIDGER